MISVAVKADWPVLPRVPVCSFCITFLLLAYKNRHTSVGDWNHVISELPNSAEIGHWLRRGIVLAASGADNEPDELQFTAR
jgi:hypothetical protein